MKIVIRVLLAVLFLPVLVVLYIIIMWAALPHDYYTVERDFEGPVLAAKLGKNDPRGTKSQLVPRDGFLYQSLDHRESLFKVFRATNPPTEIEVKNALSFGNAGDHGPCNFQGTFFIVGDGKYDGHAEYERMLAIATTKLCGPPPPPFVDRLP